MTSGFFTGEILRGLAARVLFFLSLALFPIGLIAVSQTQQISKQNKLNAELSLIAMTELASSAERRVLQEAFSAADALGSIVRLHHDDPVACSAFFQQYQAANPSYAMTGFIQSNGLMSCSSVNRRFDFSGDPAFQDALTNPRRQSRTLEIDASSNSFVTVVTAPVVEQGQLKGFIAVSIPFETFNKIPEPELLEEPLALMTFNTRGDILTTERGLATSGPEAPVEVDLASFIGKKATVFEAKNQQGATRFYAVQPIVPDAVYAISAWPLTTPFMNPSIMARLGSLLPVAMWAASLIVAFWSLNRLAIRHIRKLGRQMRRFALNRNLPRTTLASSVPTELVEMEAAFISMGESILRDEATLEDSLREKNILLKEVHHRVKNNLQLISSIMNMQIRQARSADSRRVLQRLQERILGLATVHKNLYQNDNLARVDASVLLHEVVNQLLSVGLAAGSNVKVTQEYAPISLDADDAAPLTLLVSEAVTNALKHVPQGGDLPSALTLRLTTPTPDLAKLVIANTTGTEPDQDGTGLGSRLIDAFARQLNGQTEVRDEDDTYHFSITFPVPHVAKQIRDF